MVVGQNLLQKKINLDSKMVYRRDLDAQEFISASSDSVRCPYLVHPCRSKVC